MKPPLVASVAQLQKTHGPVSPAAPKLGKEVNGNVIEIRPLQRKVREGWAQDSQRLAAAGDDALQWPEFGNEGDAELVW